MANFSETEFRTVIEDTRTRHAAVIALIYRTDNQAAGLLRLFLTVGVSAASAAYATFPSMPPVAFALGSTALMTIVGSFFCLLAMSAAKIRLPGYDPDFWLWALRPDVSQPNVLQKYLENLETGTRLNADVNYRTARTLSFAKAMVTVTIITAIVAGAIASRVYL
jgi:hypothetical protein